MNVINYHPPHPPPHWTPLHLCESNKGIPRNEMYHLCSDHNFVWFIRTNEALNGRLDINFRHAIHFFPLSGHLLTLSLRKPGQVYGISGLTVHYSKGVILPDMAVLIFSVTRILATIFFPGLGNQQRVLVYLKPKKQRIQLLNISSFQSNKSNSRSCIKI